jgi:multidrug resistance efflux pump
MFIAVTGLVLVYMIPLGVADELRMGKEASPDQAIPMEKVVSIAVSQDLPGADSVEDIFRIEYRPSANVYQVRFNNGQGVQMDVSTGKVLSTNPDYSTFLITLHDGSFFGNWYRYSALTFAGLSLILLSFSGYYMVGYPFYKRLMARKKSNRLIYLLLGAVFVLAVFIFAGKKAGWIGGERELEIETALVSKRNITEKVSASGIVQPEMEVKLSPDVAGEIIELNVIEGDSVKLNDLLVKIRPDNFISALDRAQATLNQQMANLAQSRASLKRAEAQFTRANLAFERNQKLYEDKVISDSDFEQAKAEFLTAQNDLEAAEQTVLASEYIVKSAKATVDEAAENLRLTNVYSPTNGVVSKLLVEKGERVVGTAQMAGTEMVRIADLSRMEVRVNVNENDIVRISMNDTTIIDVDSYAFSGKKFTGVVTSIANSANEKASSRIFIGIGCSTDCVTRPYRTATAL